MGRKLPLVRLMPECWSTSSPVLIPIDSAGVPPEVEAFGCGFHRRLWWPANRLLQLLFPSSNSRKWWNLSMRQAQAEYSYWCLLQNCVIRWTQLGKHFILCILRPSLLTKSNPLKDVLIHILICRKLKCLRQATVPYAATFNEIHDGY